MEPGFLTYEDFMTDYNEIYTLKDKAKMLANRKSGGSAEKQIQKISKKIYKAAKKGKTFCFVYSRRNSEVIDYFMAEDFWIWYDSTFHNYVIEWD